MSVRANGLARTDTGGVTVVTRPVVGVGGMGGTIAMRPSVIGQPVTPSLAAGDLVAAVPALAGIAQLQTHTVCNVGSPSVTFDHVLDALAWADGVITAGACGVVLTHGTDTLEESAYLIDLLWRHPQPIVLTGAMRSAEEPGSDGPANLLSAVLAATSPVLRGLGALVVIDDAIHLAEHVTKTHPMAVSTFASPWSAPIGRVQEGQVHLDFLPAFARPDPLDVPASRAARIAVVEATLGDDGSLLQLAVDGGYDGLVIAGAGAGHVSAPAAAVIEELTPRVPIVVATRTGSGRTATNTYGYPGAEVDLVRRGAIMAGVLSARKARLLLWLLVGNGADRDRIVDEFALRGRGG